MRSPLIYEIEVSGRLDWSWSDWFAGMAIEHRTNADGSTVTRLTGPIRDQAMLRSILDHLFDLNITLLSVQRQSADDCSKTEAGLSEKEYF